MSLESGRKASREYNRRWAKENGIARSTMQRRKLKQTNPEHYSRLMKNANLKRNYGITLEQYDEMIQNQNGLCKICNKPPEGVSLHVDHNHQTGQIRGLLCGNCNYALGHIHEDIKILDSMKEYLQLTP